MKTISATTLLERLATGDSSFIVLDVRTPFEWKEASLGNDERIKYIEMMNLESRLSELPKDFPIYVLCRSGNRSGMVTKALSQIGYDAYNVEGGMIQVAFLQNFPR